MKKIEIMNNEELNLPTSYEQAFNELQKIVSEIEQGDITIDLLLPKVQRAAELIKYCRDKLRNTEEEVSKIIKQLEDGSDGKAE
ncbi:MAG: exodeoxyribonuclease VII small subunit [Bacteroidales bacterium]